MVVKITHGKEHNLYQIKTFTEVRCYKHRLNTTSIVSPDKNDYSYNEPVHFHCDGDHILHGPSSARCTENGWKYDGPSLPVCRRKWVYMHFIIILVTKVTYCDPCLSICVRLSFVKTVEQFPRLLLIITDNY